jgi:hypothetical protein
MRKMQASNSGAMVLRNRAAKLTLGSTRALACGFRRPRRKQGRMLCDERLWRGRQRQHARARVLPNHRTP